MELSLRALSIVLDHWIRPSTAIRKRAFISKLGIIYRDRYDVYVLENMSRAIYSSDEEERPRLEYMTAQHAGAMLDRGTNLQRCFLCGNRRRIVMEVNMPFEDVPYKFGVSIECRSWRCNNYQIYVF